MINIGDNNECCGCEACKNVCPKGCISFHFDSEGFGYPKIDKDRCVKCNLCESVCPQKNSPPKINIKNRAYGCKNKNLDERLSSSSGGVFYTLCKYVVDKKGVVFGACFNEDLQVEHSFEETLEGCRKFRGSKYVQSRINESYNDVKMFLLDKRLVLFSGTPCQIKGLKLFLKIEYENLITADLACHGVPSPLVFDRYLKTLSRDKKIKPKDIDFRNKKLGWNLFSFKIEFDDCTSYERPLYEEIYMRGFISDLFLRPSCYKCKSKNFSSKSDFTLADYWGVGSVEKDFADDIGVSLVFVNTTKANEIFKVISLGLESISTDKDMAIKYNPAIISDTKIHPNREKFFSMLDKKGIVKAIKKCVPITVVDMTKWKIKQIIRGLKDIG